MPLCASGSLGLCSPPLGVKQVLRFAVSHLSIRLITTVKGEYIIMPANMEKLRL
jgi:hypothetical protein